MKKTSALKFLLSLGTVIAVSTSQATFAAAPIIYTESLQFGVTGQAFSRSILLSALPANTTVAVAGLPTGVSATLGQNGKSLILLNGTPTQAGSFDLQVQASNADGTSNAVIKLVVLDATGGGAQAVTTGVAASARVGCAIVNGGLQCWGDRSSGVLGHNVEGMTSVGPYHALPNWVIAPGRDVTHVSVGEYHGCAVADGGLVCWGANNLGQFGDGSTTSSFWPVQVVPAKSGITRVAVGTAHTCIVRLGGVQCFGGFSAGTLGIGSTTGSLTPVQTIAVNGGAGEISSADATTCAVVTGGLQCWGNNTRGLLGDGTQVSRSTPTTILAANTGVTRVALAANHGCATQGGALKCWGASSFGETGQTRTTAIAPALTVPTATSGVTDVFVGRGSTCFLQTASLMCMGGNFSQQFGFGSPTSTERPIQIRAAALAPTHAAVGDSTICTITRDGLQCAGRVDYGALGDGSIFRSEAPQLVSQSSAAQLSGSGSPDPSNGDLHQCMVVDGGVQCWGFNGNGQLGNGTNVANNRPQQAIAAGNGATGVSASEYSTCAVVDGGVSCWGYGDFGQLGNGGRASSATPVAAIGGGSGATVVAKGGDHACAIVRGGVSCWGLNFDGQLGVATSEQFLSRPTPVTALSDNVTALATGAAHNCALRAGTVWCWGYNEQGQLGDGTLTNRRAPVAVVGLPSGTTALFARGHTTCAISSGNAYCWGNNSYNQFGPIVGTSSAGTNNPKPTLVSDTSGTVTDIAIGARHSCQIRAGAVLCAGSTGFGALGQNRRTDALTQFTTLFPASFGVTTVSVTSMTTCVSAPSGVFCMGSANNGILGSNAVGAGGLVKVLLRSTGTVIPNGKFTGMWSNPNESGWGASLIEKGNIVFAAIYTYDAAGRAKWYVISRCEKVVNSCSGEMIEVQNGNSPNQTWTGARKVVVVGAGTFTFTAENTLRFYSKIGQQEHTENLQLQIFGGDSAQYSNDYTDLYNDATQSGWGLSLIMRKSIAFMAWYTFNDDGTPTWYVASRCEFFGNRCSAPLYALSEGLPLHQFQPSTAPKLATVREITLVIDGPKDLSLRYSVNGVPQVKTVSRFAF